VVNLKTANALGLIVPAKAGSRVSIVPPVMIQSRTVAPVRAGTPHASLPLVFRNSLQWNDINKSFASDEALLNQARSRE
jgi:hypothetical protein